MLITGNLSPAIDGIRLSLHVLAATVWVGGQLTVAGLLPTVRRLGDDAGRRIARAFARLSWPAFLVLVATGIWNIAAVSKGQPGAWKVVFGVELAVVLLAALGTGLHQRAQKSGRIGGVGAVAATASVAALVLGVFLAG